MYNRTNYEDTIYNYYLVDSNYENISLRQYDGFVVLIVSIDKSIDNYEE